MVAHPLPRWFAAAGLLLCSCGTNRFSNPDSRAIRARVAIDATTVKAGQELHVRVDRAPEGWSGEITVNGLRHFPVYTNRYSLRATVHNGFRTKGPTELFILLMDSKGHEIPLGDSSRYEIQVVPASVRVSPDTSNVGSGNSSGTIHVAAPAMQKWSVSGVPSWIEITSGSAGEGDGTITYKVAENTSPDYRSSVFNVGDTAFEIVQLSRNAGAIATNQSASPVPKAPRGKAVKEAEPPELNVPTAKVTVDKTMVRMGQEIKISMDQVPEGWSGEITVNSLRHFPVHSALYGLRATVQNGFNGGGQNDLFILLIDNKGHEIRVANSGHFPIRVVPASVIVSPEGDNAGAGGGVGLIRVAAGSGFRWSVSGIPDWIKITSGDQGVGDGIVAYRVAENTTSAHRSAVLTIGDASFEVTQLRPPTISQSNQGPGKPPQKNDTARNAGAEGRGQPVATVSLDQPTVKLGQDLQLRVDHVPDGWSGLVTINSLRHFPVNSKLYTMKASVQNGFNPIGPTEIVVLLVDQKGHEIPVADQGHLHVTIASAGVILTPERASIPAAGGADQIRIAAGSARTWAVAKVPDWIKITSGSTGTGSGHVAYSVAENTSNEPRSAVISIGEVPFQVTQLRASSVMLPFQESFSSHLAPLPVWSVNRHQAGGPVEYDTRWILDEQPGQHAIVRVSADGPGGSNSLVIERPAADEHSWATQIYLPGIRTEEGAKYRATLWLKAQNPGTIAVTFGQNSPPYSNCGLTQTVSVTPVWTEFTFPFQATGKDCGAGNNRLGVEAGRIAGPLWVSKFSISPEWLSIAPENENVESGGGSGQIQVTAVAGAQWSIGGVPEWIQITSGEKGAGSRTVTYKVAENTGNEARSAVLRIGETAFRVTQQRPHAVSLPYQESFVAIPAPVWTLHPVKGMPIVERRSRWILDEQGGERSGLSLTAEGPGGSRSLVVERPSASEQAWTTQIYLPGVATEDGAKYRVSFWLKAEHAGQLTLTFGQSTAPYANCGMSQTFSVSTAWTEYAFPFRAVGKACGAVNNRLSFEAGRISGKLWISRFALAPNALNVSPESESLGPAAGTGVIHVTAMPGVSWSVKGVPDWMQITSGGEGPESRNVIYKVTENSSNELRSAILTIGDVPFQITQQHPAAILLPYQESFNAIPAPVWTLHTKGIAGMERFSRWVLDEQPGEHSTVNVAREAPGGGNSLVLQRPRANERSWVTQVYLPGLGTQDGVRYRVSVWLKAQKPGLVSLTFGQRTTPYGNCGLSQTFSVTSSWHEYTAPFRVAGKTCGAANNRLSIEAGKIGGSLWISKLSVTPAMLSIAPESESVGPEGGAGSIHVIAQSGISWSVSGVPEWIKVTPVDKGSGNRAISYQVARNTTKEPRAALILIGDARFRITQRHPSNVLPPDVSNFSEPPLPVWSLPPDRGLAERSSRWILDEQPGQGSVINITDEGPGNAKSLVIERPRADEHAWATQVYLAGIDADEGAKYHASLWLKAEKPGPVWLTFGQRTAPYANCGLSQTVTVPAAWIQVAFPFRVHGTGCGGANNRFSIEAGRIEGKLWVSKVAVKPYVFSLAPDADTVGAGGGAAQIRVTAPSGSAWSVKDVPAWMTIAEGGQGAGNGVVRYRIAENRSNQHRTATVHIGDAEFEVNQARSAYTYLPFTDNFSPPPARWIPEAPVVDANAEPASRWVLLDLADRKTTIRISTESPKGGHSVVLQRPPVNDLAWKTQFYLPRIQTEEGGKYRVTLWLKTSKPGMVWLEFGQRTAPFRPCGLSERVWVTGLWTEYTLEIRTAGTGCGGENNRLSLHTGAITGRLWLANVSIVKMPEHVVEQRARR